MQDNRGMHGGPSGSSGDSSSSSGAGASTDYPMDVPCSAATGSTSDVTRLKRNLVPDPFEASDHALVANGASLGPGPSSMKAEDGAGASSSSFQCHISSPVDRQVVRLVGQHLRDLGLAKTVDMLVKESGFELEQPAAAQFQLHVLNGCWEMIDPDLKALQSVLDDEEKITEMRFLILEQQYLELLDRSALVEALRVLREDLSPLKFNTDRLHLLSSLLMYNNAQELRQAAGWDGDCSQSRQKLMTKLQSFLPASVMLPPRRLQSLLEEAVQYQHLQCPYHNTRHQSSLDQQSLLSGHICDKDSFPTTTYQVVTDHGDEVWYCRFNHAGTLLATGSKESTVIIWSVDPVTYGISRKEVLDGHGYGAAYLTWSPDDRYLAVVGPDDSSDLWIWDAERGTLRHKLVHSADDSLSCVAWYPNSQNFVCGGTKGQFYHCDLDGNVLNSWEGIRVRGLHCKQDGRSVLAADTHNRIRSYSFDDLSSDRTLIREEHSIINFSLDASERYALLGIASQGLHLWDLEDKTLTRRYRGSTQGFYTIYSCFGGLNQDFIASGSEDNNVYIWHRNKERPVSVLSGHTGVVNAVAWNPANPSMLASCSDDGTVRLWGPDSLSLQPSLPADPPPFPTPAHQMDDKWNYGKSSSGQSSFASGRGESQSQSQSQGHGTTWRRSSRSSSDIA